MRQIVSVDIAELNVGTLLANGRYELLQRIGRGAVGNVFRARDRARNVEIALKTVVSTEPSFILSLKSEFRRLPELRHRNLVRFYELVAEGEPHFFTMELIDGVDLQSYVWQSRTFPGLSEALESRLIGALPQLADGMRALHAQGGASPRHQAIQHHGFHVWTHRTARFWSGNFDVCRRLDAHYRRRDSPVLGTGADRRTTWTALGLVQRGRDHIPPAHR